jgi:hypothetical protein
MPHGFARLIASAFVLFAANPGHAAKLGEVCGGFVGTPCDHDLWCEMKAGYCGAADMTGICVAKPSRCPDVDRAVCGCDGKIYSNDCERQKGLVSKQADGKC